MKLTNQQKFVTVFRGTPGRISRFTGSIVLGLIMVLGAVAVLLAMPVRETQAHPPPQVNAQGITKTAYIVVRYGDNDNVVRRINFTGIISGEEALKLAGLNPSVAMGGLASINGYGNPDTDPFGTNSKRFWGTSHMSGTAWTFNMYGITEPALGDHLRVEGFSWSDLNWSPVDPPLPLRMVAAADGLQWLRRQQSTDDGGYGNVGRSMETLTAVGANGCDPAEWRNGTGKPSLLSYLSTDRVAGYATNAAAAGKSAVALAAVQQVVTNYKSLNLVISITTHYSETNGAYNTVNPGEQAWAILGLRAAKQPVPITATNYLTGLMETAGCWKWGAWDNACNTNGTSLAIQALIAAGIPANNDAVVKGVTWLKAAQNDDGGFPFDPNPDTAWGGDTSSDTNSTVYVVQALLAAGEDISALAKGNPIDFILSTQQSDGRFYWEVSTEGDSQGATRQAIPALLDTSLPISSVAGMTACPMSEKYTILYIPVMYKNQ